MSRAVLQLDVIQSEEWQALVKVLVAVGIEREAAKDERDKAAADRDRYAARIKKLEAERDEMRRILK